MGFGKKRASHPPTRGEYPHSAKATEGTAVKEGKRGGLKTTAKAASLQAPRDTTETTGKTSKCRRERPGRTRPTGIDKA